METKTKNFKAGICSRNPFNHTYRVSPCQSNKNICLHLQNNIYIVPIFSIFSLVGGKHEQYLLLDNN